MTDLDNGRAQPILITDGQFRVGRTGPGRRQARAQRAGSGAWPGDEPAGQDSSKQAHLRRFLTAAGTAIVVQQFRTPVNQL